jgi:glutathione S-transferase
VLEIPTEYGDKYLFESVVICDYLDEKYPRNPLHSRDPYVKAQDRLLIERFNEVLEELHLSCYVVLVPETVNSLSRYTVAVRY